MLREALEQTGVAGLLGWREDANDGDDSIFERAWVSLHRNMAGQH